MVTEYTQNQSLMGNWDSILHNATKCLLLVLFLVKTCCGSIQHIGQVYPGFSGTPMNWVDHDGFFLLSNSTTFGFGLTTINATLSYRLVVQHMTSSAIVWSANRDSPVTNLDTFAFDDSGNVYLQSGGSSIWSTGTGNKGVSAMELWDSGNLVLMGTDRNPIWQSFSYPTDTLLSDQKLLEGMKLTSEPGSNRLNYTLEIKSGNMILSADFDPPQPYWSVGSDSRIIINKAGNNVSSAVLVANSWNFYDRNDSLLWRFVFSGNADRRATWAAVLGSDGSVTFTVLQAGSPNPSSTKIPQDDCNKPSACNPYHICYPVNTCQCPSSIPSCNSLNARPSCNERTARSSKLVSGGEGISYPVLPYVQPSMPGTTLENCKSSCLARCSCAAMFFEGDSGNCFLFDEIGSMASSSSEASVNNYTSFIKVSSDENATGNSGNRNNNSNKPFPVGIIIAIVLGTLFVISCILFAGFRIYKKNGKIPDDDDSSESEEESFFEGISGMPLRFTYKDLQAATDNFSVKLGHGGFGSVYRGTLPDGTRLAVKQLESIGQGKKEFRAEVSIIGSIHHLHLVRLKGFCAEGTHRLLAYEFMSNGSLDRWLFRREGGVPVLDWETRYSIALGTAKGLAYLHEDCDVKIVHCDIKPENVLLDDRFMAKVSDFGLAKLMTREQSHVFTTMRGTRGYLAPEWITNYAISEKSDVYSYGMVLLELVGGRKNYDESEVSERSHFPSYAFKMLEEGKVKDIVDGRLKIDEGDERVGVAIRVALWCIQDDMHLRPSMAKVVQMLEGICSVPEPPISSPLGSRVYASFMKSTSGEGMTSSSGPSDCNSDAYISAVQLSGPR